jgi:hypothetical protein
MDFKERFINPIPDERARDKQSPRIGTKQSLRKKNPASGGAPQVTRTSERG